ncbi:LysR substrate-binding domain-containing protein [Ramlibacter tataouinensis]|uniref:LysR substrate-binding domain-containing protein n=1 Tax=Ramlibacter tataouinensis (strain ATCC BAA-407 / DSM 14655 / LMG 21543 / TTB310) TaxID=365046 RepID=F5XW18_RAMTT|nr:LysR substrate-binding domain-containing protein [Ramlibacter tataouinensis]AEG94121.1 Hypothetical protein Rta_30120 [Ramlibacter tataouinensis TTB310]
MCAIPAGHRLAERRTIRPADLDRERFIALSPEDTVRRRLNQVLEAAGVRPTVVVETPNSATVTALVQRGIGVGLTNPFANDAATRGVVFRPFQADVHFRTLLIFRPDTQKSRLVKELVASLIAARNTRPGEPV